MIALSTGHQVGLAVTAAVFILFALASSFLFPRYRPNYPGNGLLAFVVVSFVFFFGMLTAVEVFGAESAEGGGEEHVAETGAEQPTTVQRTTTQQQPSQPQPTTTQATTTQSQPPHVVKVTETEFQIALRGYDAKAGPVTFVVTNKGKIPHDFAVKGGPKTKLIQSGGTAKLSVTLEPGKQHFYCSVAGHEQAGMKVDVTVS